MSSYYNQGIQVVVANQNVPIPGIQKVSLIPFIQNAYDKGLLNFNAIPPGSIDFTEIQNINSGRLLGRYSAGSGIIEEIKLGTGLSFTGDTLNAAGGSPAGSNGEIQFNNSGAFGASSNLFWSNATKTLKIKSNGTADVDTVVEIKDSADRVIYRIANSGIVEINKANNALTQNTAVIKSVGADADIGLALMPKGNGAITAQVPDGTVAGGNARGQYAVDLQMVRTANTQVASGQYSFVGGGASNVASGGASFVAGGSGNVASGESSFVGGGDYSQASGKQSASFGANADSYVDGGFAQSNLSFSARNGYTQANQFVAAQKSTGSSDFYVNIGDTRIEGAGTHWIPKGTNRNVRVRMQVIITTNDKGNGSGTTGDVYASDITFTVKKVSNNISILASPVEENKQYDSSMSDLAILVTADNATKEVKIQVRPPSSTGSTTKYRAVATLRCTEVAW